MTSQRRTCQLLPAGLPAVVPTVRLLVVLCVWAPNCSQAAVGDRYWSLSPYEIQVYLAIEAPGRLQGQLESELPRYVQQRIDAAMGPVWTVDWQSASGPLRFQLLRRLESTTLEDIALEESPPDKVVFARVAHRPHGYAIDVRVYDSYVEHWSVVISAECRQHAALGEEMFALLRRAIAPLVQFQIDTEDDDLALLEPKAWALARQGGGIDWIAPNDVLLPVLRRITREGEVVEDGIQVVPWTYLVADGERTDDGLYRAQVVSGTRRPFGVRRRGRVEQVALALRGGPRDVTIHVQSRTNPDKPLVGYEVFTQNLAEKETTPLGTTDRRGELRVPPGDSPVQMLYLKNGGQILARVPVVPGAASRVEIPLPDDDARLTAEATLAALREDLIDLVARRSILAARVRRSIDNGDFARAEQYFDQLDALPGRAQFNRRLNMVEQLHRSDDPQIQRRIEKLFADTRVVLGKFLDAQQLANLRRELDDARRSAGS